MLKLVPNEVWAFDAEWVPDPASGRRVYGLPPDMSDEDVRRIMWKEGGATDEQPRPYLKTVLCRVVSISAVIRKRSANGSVQLKLRSLPEDADKQTSEADLLTKFLSAVGRSKPQLVGYNSHGADMIILVQRALANGLHLPEFGRRPTKPWEGADYFHKSSDYNLDLKEFLAPWGKGMPSLHELATVCRIPGKLGTDGQDVVELWQKGDLKSIVAYNECDALTTYLLWLRAAMMGGQLSPEEFELEQDQLKSLLEEKAPSQPHLKLYLDAWKRLQAA